MIPHLAKTILRALLFILPCATVHAAPSNENKVKAVFIHNVAKYVEWPPAIPVNGALRLCILGQPPFTEAANLLCGKQIGGRVWEVWHVDYSACLDECRVLFIAASESGNLRHVLEKIKGNTTLTVGDTNGYAAQGVMVNFYYQESNYVRFEINVGAVRRAGLNIDSQLLRLAYIVKESTATQTGAAQ